MTTSHRGLWIRSGIAGMVGTASYVVAITVPWRESQLGTSLAVLIVSAWAILSIVYSYGLYSFIAAECEGAANRLGLLFAAVGFTTVLAMLLVQLAVGAGLAEAAKGLDAPTAAALRGGLRLIDHGLDVAWDVLIGMALVFSGMAMRRRSGFGPGWAIPSVVLGVALIALNAATFPWPPADRGLFDVGPFVGVFVFSLAARLAVLGGRR